MRNVLLSVMLWHCFVLGPQPAFAKPVSDSELAGHPPLRTFGQFVGIWTFILKNHLASGQIQQRTGTWVFHWILDGLAIQDEWKVDKERGEVRPRGAGVGTTVRIYDGKTGSWRVVWIGPGSAVVEVFTARQVGSEIIMNGSDGTGALDRWVFSAISKNSFEWRAETSSDGKAWKLAQEMSVRRATGGQIKATVQ